IDADNITFGEYRTNRIRMRKNTSCGILVESTTNGEVFLFKGGANYEKYILHLYNQQIVFDPSRGEYIFRSSNLSQSAPNPQKIVNPSEYHTSLVPLKTESCYPDYITLKNILGKDTISKDTISKDTISKRSSLVKFSSCQP